MTPKQEMQEILDGLMRDWDHPQILEAGCGSGSNISLPPDRHVVGLDISQVELDKNDFVDEKIVGDLQEHRFPADKFDLIVCWDVLEHLPTPNEALDRFVECIKPGGLILLALPNYFSLKAFVTKYTPHWFHVFVYKLLYGKGYGDPGTITFPTFMRREIASDRLSEYAAANKLAIKYMKLYESSLQERARRKYRITGFVQSIVRTFTRVFSFGRYNFDESDLILLVQRDH